MDERFNLPLFLRLIWESEAAASFAAYPYVRSSGSSFAFCRQRSGSFPFFSDTRQLNADKH